MTNRYSILLKKDQGFERQNNEIIRVLETDGWRADRNHSSGFIYLRTARNYHIYKDELAVKRYLLSILKKNEVERIVLTKETR